MASKAAIRFGPHLKELRLHLCNTSASSKGLRDFISKHYVAIKQRNPDFPILVRECDGIAPKIWARYEFGEERSVSVANMSSDQVLSIVTEIATNK